MSRIKASVITIHIILVLTFLQKQSKTFVSERMTALENKLEKNYTGYAYIYCFIYKINLFASYNDYIILRKTKRFSFVSKEDF